MLFDSGLPEDGAQGWIDSCGKPVDQHFPRMFRNMSGVRIRGQGVIVGDQVVILKFMLKSNPVLQGAHEMAEMEFTRGTHPAENDPFAFRQASVSLLFVNSCTDTASTGHPPFRQNPG